MIDAIICTHETPSSHDLLGVSVVFAEQLTGAGYRSLLLFIQPPVKIPLTVQLVHVLADYY